MDDRQIIDLFWARSEGAVAELAHKYGALCVRVAENILRNARDAEECVNDAYLGVWNTIPPQRPELLAAYLLRIVRNLAVKQYRANTAQKRNSFYDAALDELAPCIPAADTVESVYAAQELAEAINAFLDGLDADSRVLFLRRYWYADPIPDLAAHFGLSRHAVTVRLSRIRQRLRTYLEQEGITV